LKANPQRYRSLAPVRELLKSLATLRGLNTDSIEAIMDQPSAVRVGLLERMVAATIESASTGRMVIGLDDVHRYDRLSRDFLVHLLRRLIHEAAERDGRSPLRLVVTTDMHAMRDDFLRTWLQEEIDAGQVSLATTLPLSRGQCDLYVKYMVWPETPSAGLGAALEVGSGGSPRIVREAVVPELGE
jgi:hypothetical protein